MILFTLMALILSVYHSLLNYFSSAILSHLHTHIPSALWMFLLGCHKHLMSNTSQTEAIIFSSLLRDCSSLQAPFISEQHHQLSSCSRKENLGVSPGLLPLLYLYIQSIIKPC